MAINFYSESIHFTLRKKSIIKKWITTAVKKETQRIGEINYVFCDDKFLLSLNKKYLRHNTLTDIITFDFNFSERNPHLLKPKTKIQKLLSAEIYISIPRVKENAIKFNITFEKELSRVMIHGILHLLGYKDKSDKEKKIMRAKEDELLSWLYAEAI